MQIRNVEKISVSLPAETLRYAEEYQRTHGLSSRSEVLVHAFQALRERELAESYRQAAEDRKKDPSSFVDYGNTDGLEPSDGSEWL